MNEAAVALERPLASHACQVRELTPLSADTVQVELQAPAGTVLDYQAGQYLQLELEVNGEWHRLFYSIANRFDPAEPGRLQLFIQNNTDLASKVVARLAQLRTSNQDTEVQITLPLGQAFLQTHPSLAHVFIAAGSGISQIKCLVEEIVRQKPDAHASVYWSNRNIDDFYLFDEFQDWVERYENLSFTPILESAHADWRGRSGYIYQVIEEDFDQLDAAKVYLCGSPNMVYGTIDKLKATGLKEENCYSDVFEYAPRP